MANVILITEEEVNENARRRLDDLVFARLQRLGHSTQYRDNLLTRDQVETRLRGLPGGRTRITKAEPHNTPIGSCTAYCYVRQGHYILVAYARLTNRAWVPYEWRLIVQKRKRKIQTTWRAI